MSNRAVQAFHIFKGNAFALIRLLGFETIGQPHIAKAAFGVVVFFNHEENQLLRRYFDSHIEGL